MSATAPKDKATPKLQHASSYKLAKEKVKSKVFIEEESDIDEVTHEVEEHFQDGGAPLTEDQSSG